MRVKYAAPINSASALLVIAKLRMAAEISFTAFTEVLITVEVRQLQVWLTVWVKDESVESFKAEVKVKSASSAAVMVMPLVTVVAPLL